MTSLGIDIGGTNARVALVSASGTITQSAKAPVEDKTVEGVIRTVQALRASLSPTEPVTAAGVGFAAMVTGPMVVNAPNLGWRNVDLVTPLQGALKLPVHLINDLSAAAWGECAAGIARGLADTLTVFVGTGVGSAIISKGQLLGGATGVAGEFGHVKVVFEGGRACGCGQTGCLEAYAGGAKLTEWMRESGLPGFADDLEKAALAGDKKSLELYSFAVNHLSLAIANQVTVLNPAMVVLGGGVLSRCPNMVKQIRATIAARSSVAANRNLKVELASLGDDSGIVGAALLALRNEQLLAG